jgi:hypothetical protein
MNPPRCSASVIEAGFRAAFRDVVLGAGVSIRQSEVTSNYGEGCTDEEFSALPASEVTDDWTRIPDSELERARVAFFDPPAFRYYIPALALSLLRNYDGGVSMRVIGTLGSLCPHPGKSFENANAVTWALLDSAQRAAIAHFLKCLPELVALEFDEPASIERALNAYWLHFLEAGENGG